MNKLKLSLAICAATVAFSSCSNETKPTEDALVPADSGAAEVSYTLNVDSSSKVLFKASMVGIYEHQGNVNFASGSISTKGGQLSGGTFTIDLNSIVMLDNNFDTKKGKTQEKLKGHLLSPDFFDAANFPTATFTIKSVNGNESTGILNVRGKENEEKVTGITIHEMEGMIHATGKLTFDRQKYGVAYSTGAKDMVISDDINLEITLKATKAAL